MWLQWLNSSVFIPSVIYWPPYYHWMQCMLKQICQYRIFSTKLAERSSTPSMGCLTCKCCINVFFTAEDIALHCAVMHRAIRGLTLLLLCKALWGGPQNRRILLKMHEAGWDALYSPRCYFVGDCWRLLLEVSVDDNDWAVAGLS